MRCLLEMVLVRIPLEAGLNASYFLHVGEQQQNELLRLSELQLVRPNKGVYLVVKVVIEQV